MEAGSREIVLSEAFVAEVYIEARVPMRCPDGVTCGLVIVIELQHH